MDNNCSEEIIILTMFMMLIVIMVIMFMFIRLMVMMIIPVLPFIIHDHDYICSEEFVVKICSGDNVHYDDNAHLCPRFLLTTLFMFIVYGNDQVDDLLDEIFSDSSPPL